MSIRNPKHIAVDFLSRRDHSVRELQTKLRKKGVGDQDIAETIDWLKEKKLLDDRVFAAKRAEALFRSKPVGPKWIEAKLRAAGISQNIVDDVIGSLATEQEWNERSKKAIAAWKKVHPKYADDTIRHQRFLMSRGFTQFEFTFGEDA